MTSCCFFWLSSVFYLFIKPAAPVYPEMVFVSGGNFFQGDAHGNADEKPIRRVRLSDFYIGKTELTLAQFEQFIQNTGYQTDAERGAGSYVWGPMGWAKKAGVSWRHDEQGALRSAEAQNYPVMHVSWQDAAHYCNWLSVQQNLQPCFVFQHDTVLLIPGANGFRLPTEAEWAFAAAGGQTRDSFLFSGSANLSEVAWYLGNARKSAHPVGQKKPNKLGLSDCSGNVWEWCQDWYAPDAYSVQSDTLNPAGPANGTTRVIRGGSWSNNSSRCRIANRSNRFPDARDCNLGFRLARSPGTP